MFLQEQEPDQPDRDKLDVVLALSQDFIHQSQQVERLEQELSAAKEALRDLAHRRLPDAMDAAGTDSLGLPEQGIDIRLRPWFEGSLPKVDPKDPSSAVRRQAAIDWLTQHEHGDLIKTTIVVLFGRHEHNVAKSTFEAIREYLASQGLPNIVAMQEDVHHMTYKAFLREQTEAGNPLPLDTLNASIGRVARIEERKK